MILVRVNGFGIIGLIDESCQIPSTLLGTKYLSTFTTGILQIPVKIQIAFP